MSSKNRRDFDKTKGMCFLRKGKKVVGKMKSNLKKRQQHYQRRI